MIRIVTQLKAAFSKHKTRPAPKFTLSAAKINKELNGFLLYQNEKDWSHTMLTACLGAFCTFAAYNYTRLPDDLQRQYMIFGIALGLIGASYISRTNKTVKRLVLDAKGDKIRLTRFTNGGFGEQTVQAGVQLLRGIGKGTVFGGNVIKGGGIYGFEERNYWFQRKWIKDRDAFEWVVQGGSVKVQ